MTRKSEPLALFHPAVREWFEASFEAPTRPQRLGWPAIARGDSTLILAPTGSGKTLAAFLWAIHRVMFAGLAREAGVSPKRRSREGGSASPQNCRILYVSPLKALAVDV